MYWTSIAYLLIYLHFRQLPPATHGSLSTVMGWGAGGRAALETQGPNGQEKKAGPTQVDPHVTLGRKGLAIRAATEPCLGSQTLPHLLNPHICSATQTSPTR